MDAVALAATISGGVVALAGVCVTAWGIRQQSESAKELAAQQQAHERGLASGARLFEKRSAVYEQMIGVLHRWTELVDRTEPVMTIVNEPEPPEEPSVEEQRALNAVLRTFGSPAVANAYDDFVKTMRGFFGSVGSFRAARQQGATVTPWRELHDSREKVHAELKKMELLVSDELASL